MKEEKVLKVEEKSTDKLTHAQSMDMLITQKKMEYDNIQHQLRIAKGQLTTVQEKTAQERTDFNARMAKEKQDFEQSRQITLNDLAHREENMLRGEENLAERTRVVNSRELEANKVADERKQLFDSRVETERVLSQAKIELEKATSLSSEAQTKLNQASEKEAEIKKKLEEDKNILSTIEREKELLALQENGVKEQINNLEKIREEVKPKIEESEALKIENQKILDEIEKSKNEADAKIEEDKKLLNEVAKREEAVKEKSIELGSREEEIIRKELLLNIGN